jgi:hypothetical protein
LECDNDAVRDNAWNTLLASFQKNSEEDWNAGKLTLVDGSESDAENRMDIDVNPLLNRRAIVDLLFDTALYSIKEAHHHIPNSAKAFETNACILRYNS